MSYEIPGFDPTSEQENAELSFTVWHGNINSIGFHVVHAQELYRRIEAGQKIPLIDYENPGTGNIASIKASVADGENYSGQRASIYSADIALRKEKEWTDSFIKHTDKTSYTRIKSSGFYWSNTRMLIRPETQFIASATVHSRLITLHNQTTGTHPDKPLLSTRLSAPARKDVVVGKQIVHFFDSLSAMMCVAHSLGKEEVITPGGNFIITPDGPLYKNPDTGDYVHHLGPEKVTLTSAKKPEKPTRAFDQFFGIESVIAALRPLVLFYKQPELAKKWGVSRPGNVLLFGPAGTGKTALIEALATEIGADKIDISPAEIYGKWMGDSEKAMQAVFDKARQAKKPTILFFDEMEGIVNIVDNDTSGSRATNGAAGIFKTQSARICDENPNVILAATTNNPDRIDPALIRAGRFDMRIAVGLPDENARHKIFSNLIFNNSLVSYDADPTAQPDAKAPRFTPYSPELLKPEALANLAELTDQDFSPSDIIEVLRRAALGKASEEATTLKEPELINLAYLTKIIAEMRRNRI